MRIFTLFTLLFLIIANADAKPKIVTSFTILEDITKEIAGDKAEIINIVKYNSDAHKYQPTPAEIKDILNADLFIINGLHFESWIKKFEKIRKKPTLRASRNITYQNDPHAWHDISQIIIYVENITNALIKVDPVNKHFYQQNQKSYTKKLIKLDQHIKSSFATFDASKRKVVSTHNAFKYYEHAYGITFITPHHNLNSQTSARALAHLIKEIKDNKLQVIFLEPLSNKRLINQIKSETNIQKESILYADSIPPHISYFDMMQQNTKNIINSIKLIK